MNKERSSAATPHAKPYIQSMHRRVAAYYELAKPERTLANVITALAGYLFASKRHLHWSLLVALLVGSTLIIASACVANNVIDRDLDKKMARTKKRVLITGAVSARSAIIFAVLLGLVGSIALAYTNWLTFGVGVVAYVSYVALYDFAKRTTIHSTLVGTVPGAASLVAGYTAVTNRLDTAAWLLFLIMVAWQMAHFYAIATYRLQDYVTAGMPIWPARYGIRNTKIAILIYIAIFLVANILLTTFGYTGVSYAVALILLGGYWLLHGVSRFNSGDDTKWAHSMFGVSLMVLLIFAGLLTIGPILP